MTIFVREYDAECISKHLQLLGTITHHFLAPSPPNLLCLLELLVTIDITQKYIYWY